MLSNDTKAIVASNLTLAVAIKDAITKLQKLRAPNASMDEGIETEDIERIFNRLLKHLK
jgi:hypothetical protein